MNIAADKAINADKRRDIEANKELKFEANKAVIADERQDAVAGK